MKKLLTIILSATLILSTTACGLNSEVEALKEENKKLKAQLESAEKRALQNLRKIQHQVQQKINLLTIILHMNLLPAIMKFQAIFRLANMTL